MEFPLKILCINRAIKFRIASPRWSISINKNHCPCQHEFHKAEITLSHRQTYHVHEYLLPYAQYQVRYFITWSIKHYFKHKHQVFKGTVYSYGKGAEAFRGRVTCTPMF